MRERALAFEPDAGATIAGTLCLPEDASRARRVPAVALFGGTFGDTRDGDMAPERNPYASDAPKSGLLRRIAHVLADRGVASYRYDKRGCGESSGTPDIASDARDAIGAVRAMREAPEIDRTRVGVAGHSAGASHACTVMRELPEIACAGLLGMLYGSIEDLVRFNWGRLHAYWQRLSEEQRGWMRAHRRREVVAAFRADEILAAAARGDTEIVLEAEGVSASFQLEPFRQGIVRLRERPRDVQLRDVRCPALVLHGGEDMNVRVEDALETYRALRRAGNERVALVIVPGLDHNFQPAAADATERTWERFSFLSQARPVSPVALGAIAEWAARVLRADVPPRAPTAAST